MQEDVGEYRNRIHFIPQMHGGIMFIRKDKTTQEIYDLALQVAQDYSKYRFKYFEKPADEPILALSMAVFGCEPIEVDNNQKRYVFFPAVKRVRQNMQKGCLSFTYDDKEWHNDILLLHWQNVFTNTPDYRMAVDSIGMGENWIKDTFIRVKWPMYYLCELLNKTVFRVVRSIKRRIDAN